MLLATLKKNLTLARNMREQKRLESGTAKSRKVPGNIAVHNNLCIMHVFFLSLFFLSDELKELWLSHKDERSSILKEYERRILVKIDQLERTANKSWATEEGLNKALQQQLKATKNSSKLLQTQ